jgi:dihydroxyacetone kinase-like protein
VNIVRDAILEWVKAFAAIIADNKDYLTQLDSAIGDADHGNNMNRGMQAVIAKLPTIADKDIGTILKTVGMTLVSTVGGASGPLYGTFFMQMGSVTANKMELAADDWIRALEAGVGGVLMRGKPILEDKTMYDALQPALETLKTALEQNRTLYEALQDSAAAAEKGRNDTIPLLARKGRASYLGERSVGHQDPGATSAHLLLWTAAQTLLPVEE